MSLPASLTTFAANHETYGAAIYDARKAGLVLCKYADPTEGERRDPTEGERRDLTDEEAADIAREDISLIYVDRPRDLYEAIYALPADDVLVTDPRPVSEFVSLCQSWADDVGAQQDGSDTVAIARRALGGDADALRIVLSW